MKLFSVYAHTPRIVKNCYGEDVRVHVYLKEINVENYKTAKKMVRDDHPCHTHSSPYNLNMS